MKSYDVKFWAIRPGKAKTKRTYEVRWKVGHSPQSRTLGNKAQADNFLSELRQAARKGEAFDTETGLPDSLMTTASRERSWLTFCLAYTDMKWPSAAPKTRDSLTDALATLIPVSPVSQPRTGSTLPPSARRCAISRSPQPHAHWTDHRLSRRRCAGWRKPRSRSALSASPSMPAPPSTPSPCSRTARRPALPRSRGSGRCSPT